MLGGPAFAVLAARDLVSGNTPDPTAAPSPSANLLMLAYVVGWLCSAAGLRRLRATGRGRGAAVLTAVQLTALTLAAGQNLQDLARARPLGDGFYRVTDVAWPFSHVFMLAVFAAVWRARVWTGWRRWTPLACGLVLPLTFAAVASRGVVDPMYVFAFGTAVAFLAFGLAVATTRRGATATQRA
jgi:sulfite exporter TauE/SafE